MNEVHAAAWVNLWITICLIPFCVWLWRDTNWTSNFNDGQRVVLFGVTVGAVATSSLSLYYSPQ